MADGENLTSKTREALNNAYLTANEGTRMLFCTHAICYEMEALRDAVEGLKPTDQETRAAEIEDLIEDLNEMYKQVCSERNEWMLEYWFSNASPSRDGRALSHDFTANMEEIERKLCDQDCGYFHMAPCPLGPPEQKKEDENAS